MAQILDSRCVISPKRQFSKMPKWREFTSCLTSSSAWRMSWVVSILHKKKKLNLKKIKEEENITKQWMEISQGERRARQGLSGLPSLAPSVCAPSHSGSKLSTAGEQRQDRQAVGTPTSGRSFQLKIVWRRLKTRVTDSTQVSDLGFDSTLHQPPLKHWMRDNVLKSAAT